MYFITYTMWIGSSDKSAKGGKKPKSKDGKKRRRGFQRPEKEE